MELKTGSKGMKLGFIRAPCRPILLSASIPCTKRTVVFVWADIYCYLPPWAQETQRFRSRKVQSISRAAVERRQSMSSTRLSSLCVFIVMPATASMTASAIFVVFSLDPARLLGHQLIAHSPWQEHGQSVPFQVLPEIYNANPQDISPSPLRPPNPCPLHPCPLRPASSRFQEGNVHDEQCHNFVCCVHGFWAWGGMENLCWRSRNGQLACHQIGSIYCPKSSSHLAHFQLHL